MIPRSKTALNNPQFPDKIQIEIQPGSKNGLSAENAKFINYLRGMERIIVFSSHLDDAVLSMGSLIDYLAINDIKIQIVTVFTECSNVSSPSIKRLLSRDNFSDSDTYFSLRREEDKKALAELKIDHTIHLGYVDAAWRIADADEALYPDYQLVAIKPQDELLHKELVMDFKKLIGSIPKTAVFGPLSMGNHVDHQIVRNAVNEAFPHAIFYQDFPYSAIHENENSFITQKKLHSMEWKGSYEAKKRAIFQYKTQLKSFTLFFNGTIQVPYEQYYFSPTII